MPAEKIDALTTDLFLRPRAFRPELEKHFYADYFTKSLTQIRIALGLAFSLYALFGFLDIWIAPMSRNTIWLIRYALVCPLLALFFILTYRPIFLRVMQPALALISIIMGFGISAMIAVAHEIETGLFYYAGLILVIMWSHALVRLRFVYATVASWIIVLGYELTAIFIQRILSSEDLIRVFINNNFFFISANVIGMFVSFLMESYIRRDFLQRQLIAQNRNELARERNELAVRNDIMQEELQMAERIQHQIVPSVPPGDNIAFLYRPMEELGGDFYDFIKFRDDHRIGIFISDVSGHGVPAALITSMLKTLIVDARLHRENPARLMSHLNQILVEQTEHNFITAFYAIYNSESRELEYCNAGHLPPYIVHDGGLKRLVSPTHLPLALLGEDSPLQVHEKYKTMRTVLPRGAKLFMFTDGLVEARRRDSAEVQFEKELAASLLAHATLNPGEFIAAVYGDLVAFKGEEKFDDDICLVCLEAE